MNILCDHIIEAGRPDIDIIDKVEKSAIIIDAAMAGDENKLKREGRN